MKARSEDAPTYTADNMPAMRGERRYVKVWRLETRRTRESVDVPCVIVRCPADAAAAFKQVLGEDRPVESLVVLYLDARHRMIGYEIAATGGTNSVSLTPGDIFRGAIAACAVAIVIAHNHPSGDCAPSTDDIELTRRVRAAGEVIGVALLDHIVIAGENYRSAGEG